MSAVDTSGVPLTEAELEQLRLLSSAAILRSLFSAGLLQNTARVMGVVVPAQAGTKEVSYGE